MNPLLNVNLNIKHFRIILLQLVMKELISNVNIALEQRLNFNEHGYSNIRIRHDAS